MLRTGDTIETRSALVALPSSLDFAAILEAVQDGILVVDAEHIITYANARVAELFGHLPGALIGKGLDCLLPRGAGSRHAAASRAFSTASSERSPHRAALVAGRHADGHELAVFVSISRLASGPVAGAVAIIRDATAQIAQERELRESERRFQRVAEASRDVLYEWTPSEGTVWHADALQRVLGLHPTDFRDRAWWAENIHPDDRDRVFRSFERYNRARESIWSEEYRVRRGDGEYARILNRSVATRDALGKVTHAVGALMDVTELREAEDRHRAVDRAFRDVAQRLSLVLDTMPVGCVVLDAAERVTLWNPAMERIAKRSSGDALGRLSTELFPDTCLGWGDDHPLETGELVIEHVGHRVICKCERTPLVDECGTPVGWVVMVQDVTEERSLMAQLIQAQKLEAMGRLAGGVAHDFNNLLTVILGNSAFLHASFFPGDARIEDLEEIRHAGHRAAELTQQLLAFARKQTFVPRVVDVERSVRNIERMLLRLLGDDVSVTLHGPDEPLRIFIDPAQLEQVLLNLAVNARDAMPSGGSLRITMRQAAEGEGERLAPQLVGRPIAVVEVRDTGTGMSQEVLARIFDPFYTTKEQGKGTGLGLSICQSLVEQAGGHLMAESTPGMGSTFRILLPTTDDEAEASATSSLIVRRGHGEVVLLVEGDEAVRALFERGLRESGYRVFAMSTAGDALQFVAHARRHVDVLVTDTLPSNADGITLLRRLSLNERPPRVVFVTGVSHDEGATSELLPDSLFLRKPITSQQLSASVRELLDN